VQGSPLLWEGISVMPAGQDAYGSDVIPAHHYHAQADLVITLLDVWALDANAVKGVPLASWIPVDTSRLADGDHAFLEISGAIPIAMSRHGERLLREAGHDPLYVPHSIDTSVFAPRADRDELRESAGLTGKFVIGILAANKDAIRKGFFPQFEAFARFRERYCSDAVLLVHSLITGPGALDLKRLAQECGIEDAVIFSNQYKLLMGLFQPSDVAAWLSMCDVLSNASMGEGFGITPLEALACGVPAVVTDCSAMTELSLGPEWLVNGEPFWNPTHASRWSLPYIDHQCPNCGYSDGIVERYVFAYEALSDPGKRAQIQAAAREKALQYDANLVFETYWRPALAELDERLEKRRAAAAGKAAAAVALDEPVEPADA
jgi:glycosyltransferase involved in cell wall biosynthesis